jgi:ketosteroid isomerase-like protein
VSQENVEISRKSFAALNAGIEALLPFYCPDVVIYPVAGWPEDSVYRGHDGARRLTAGWTENFDEWAWEVHDIREAGDRVVALTYMTGRARASGTPIRQPVGVVISDFRGGMIGAARFFTQWQAALNSVGLEE